MNTTAFGVVKYSQRTDLFLRQTGYQGKANLKGMILHAQDQISTEHFHEAAHALAELKYLGGEAAKLLGIHRETLREKLRRHGETQP